MKNTLNSSFGDSPIKSKIFMTKFVFRLAVILLGALNFFIFLPDLIASSSPDLYIQRISFLRPTNPGDVLTVESNILLKKGDKEIESSLARLRVDVGNDGIWDIDGIDKFVPSFLVTDVKTNGVGISWKDVWMIIPGTHRFEVCADVENMITESNEANNCSYLTWTFKLPSGKWPDLKVGFLSVGRGSDFLTPLALIENEGGSVASSFAVKARVDIDDDGSWDIVPPFVSIGSISYDSGEFINWPRLWQLPKTETYKIEVCADSEGKVLESNESNNCHSMTVLGYKDEDKDFPVHKSTPGYLDITFIGDNYTDMIEFHNDVKEFKNYMLNYEPFKSRSSQILFHYIDNKKDLLCQRSESLKMAVCDVDLAIKEVVNTGVPYDKLMIVAKNLIGGTVGIGDREKGSFVALFGNQKETFMHELGHTFGLMHEHIDFTNDGVAADRCELNCCMSDKCVDWQEVEGAMCIEGCTYPNWYRSSSVSIMTGKGSGRLAEYFNVVSQRIISQHMDQYTDIALPTISILTPENNDIVSGVVGVNIKTTGGVRVQQIEFYVDDKLYNTNFDPPDSSVAWDVRSLDPKSQHKLYAKAYYGEENFAVSEPIYVTVDVFPNPLADLAVKEVNFSPQNPVAGSVISFWAVIKDQGRRGSGILTTTRFFLRDPTTYNTWITAPIDRTTRPLSRGEEVLESWDLAWTARAGKYKVEICADEISINKDLGLGLQDANLGNNCLVKDLVVSETGTPVLLEKPVILSRADKVVLPLLNGKLPSAGLTPENPLYFLDIFFEGVRQLFTFDLKNKAELEMSFVAERLAEIRLVLSAKGPEAAGLKTAEHKLKINIAEIIAILEKEKNKGKEIRNLTEHLVENVSIYHKVFTDFFEEKKLRAYEKDDKGYKEKEEKWQKAEWSYSKILDEFREKLK